MAAVLPKRPVRPKPLLACHGWKYDFFLLHAGKSSNKQFEEALYDALCVKDVLPFLDSKSLKLGNDADEKMEDALVSSRFVVAIMSHEMKNKRCPEEELKKAYDRHQEKKGTVIIPVFYNITSDDCFDSTNELFQKVSRITGVERKHKQVLECNFVEQVASELVERAQEELEKPDGITMQSRGRQYLATDVVEDSRRFGPASPQDGGAVQHSPGSPSGGGHSDGQPIAESTQPDALFYPISEDSCRQMEQEMSNQVDAAGRFYSRKAVNEYVSDLKKRTKAIDRKTEQMRQAGSQSSSSSRSSHVPASSSPQLGSGGDQPHEASDRTDELHVT